MLVKSIRLLFLVYTLMLFARLIISWFPQISKHRFAGFLYHYTDPYLNIFRRIIPPLGMMDFSPIIAFFSLQILEQVVLWLIS